MGVLSLIFNKYKELWQVEQVFRDMKSVLDTRSIFHQRDETIKGYCQPNCVNFL